MATKNTSKLKTFTVNSKIIVECSCAIQAENFVDAATKAQDLKFTDFVEVLGDCMDYKEPLIQWITDETSMQD